MKQVIETRINFDKKCRLDKVCANDDLRPAMEYIYFIGGYAYATNAMILVRASLKSISNLHRETIDKLNGHCIHKNTYADLLNRETFKVENNEIISYVKDKETNKLIEDCAFNFDENKLNEFFGNRFKATFENIFSKENGKKEHFAFDPKLMKQLIDCIGYKDGFIFTPTCNGEFIVHLEHTSDFDNDIKAIFMPKLLLDNDLEYIDKRM